LHKFDLLKPEHAAKPQILELGSGTGLVGLAMASLGADVVLTDLPSIYPNLARNIRDNCELVQQNSGSVRGGVLDWTKPTVCEVFPNSTNDLDQGGVLLNTKFPVILAADSLYSPEHPRWLVDTIGAWLSDDANAKVIVEFPLRHAYLPEVKDFRQRMGALGLHVLEEGEERGYDDWGSPEDDDDETGLVKCWWSCWGRRVA
jgi:predicted nicotinamide N-methyase